MATVSKHIADQIIAGNGYYHDDPQVKQVVCYINMVGEIAYAILYDHDVAADRYAPSPFVQNPKIIWRAK